MACHNLVEGIEVEGSMTEQEGDDRSSDFDVDRSLRSLSESKPRGSTRVCLKLLALAWVKRHDDECVTERRRSFLGW